MERVRTSTTKLPLSISHRRRASSNPPDHTDHRAVSTKAPHVQTILATQAPEAYPGHALEACPAKARNQTEMCPTEKLAGWVWRALANKSDHRVPHARAPEVYQDFPALANATSTVQRGRATSVPQHAPASSASRRARRAAQVPSHRCTKSARVLRQKVRALAHAPNRARVPPDDADRTCRGDLLRGARATCGHRAIWRPPPLV